MAKQHHYQIQMKWTGNLGLGTESYTAYSRDHEISKDQSTVIHGSSDPSFRGDPQRYNPEELLLSTLSSCHMLMYLHFCAVNHITVVSYEDRPTAIMEEDDKGSGRFISSRLKPEIVILEKDKLEKAARLHHKAHDYCFIANSVNFPVEVQPIIKSEDESI